MAQRFTLGNNSSTPYSQQDMHVYHYGEPIPNYVSFSYQPHIYYDGSKSVNGGTWDIFNELGVSETLILGSEEDSLWTHEEILDEFCRYFDLHCVTLGYDTYLFDWETAKSGTSVTWIDIKTGDTKQSTYDTVLIQPSQYSDDSTSISIGDSYNQIMVTDKVEPYDKTVLSLLDDLEDVQTKQIYLQELYATGKGSKAYDAFSDLLNSGNAASYGDSDSAWIKEWWFKVKKSPKWEFSTTTWGDNYSRIPIDANGVAYQQWRLAQWVDQCPWASGIFSFGSGTAKNNKNAAQEENIKVDKDYVCINVKGNGNDITTGSAPYPSDSDIYNSGMHIRYTNNEDGLYSSSDPSITNYLVFNGTITMTIPQERTGTAGFIVWGQGNDHWYQVVNEWTRDTNNFVSGKHYMDNEAFKRRTNTMQNAKQWIYDRQHSGSNVSSGCYVVGSQENDDGRFYTQKFFEQWYPNEENTRPTETNVYLSPPQCLEGTLSKRFKYDLDNNKSYFYKQGGGCDVIPWIDVLACKLSIGEHFCCESHDENGRKVFEWLTEDELKAQNRYLPLDDGSTIYDAYIYLSIDINNQEFVVGQEHKLYNTITSNMHLDGEGMAIPLPYDKHLSGALRFSIEGVVNSTWYQGCRRHSTWFRSTKYSADEIPIMAHVDKIWIESLKVELQSDNGKRSVDSDADIVYMSDMVKKYIKRKDDIEFKFNTSLTSDEAARMGVAPILARSSVINMTTGDGILNIVNNVTNEIEKPEKFYCDAYWREYNSPLMTLETQLHEMNSHAHLDLTQFNKLQFPYLADKTFYVVKTERNMKYGTINLTLKQRND